MNDINLLKKLVYLDLDFISDCYEIYSGESPNSTITKNEGKKAGVKIPLFSGELSSIETKSFPVSTFGMLKLVLPKIKNEKTISTSDLNNITTSTYGWVEGILSCALAESKKQDTNGKYNEIKSSEIYFDIKSKDLKISLITIPGYFFSGLETLSKMYEFLKELSIPVKAYIRVISGFTYFDYYVGIPLLILEKDSNN